MITIIKNLKEPERSSIFLNNITVIDHAYIDDQGCIRGGSFNPNFIVSGKPDFQEKVVVDFSTIKKDIKKIIDKHEPDVFTNGLDHKLWIIEGYSNIENFDITKDKQRLIIQTPNVKIELPPDAVKHIPVINGQTPDYSNLYIGYALENYVKQHLQQLYPDARIDVKCINTVDEHVALNASTRPFHYVHGLKNSTSYGCQNIAHGHRSFIHADIDDPLVFNRLKIIAEELDNTVFVYEENIIKIDSNTLTIGYSTKQRGNFSMTLNTDTHKIIVLSTETTIEFLVSYINQRYGKDLFFCGAKTIYVSEGLSKGAVEQL